MRIVYDIHPAANLFPMMDDEAFAALKKDIAENGLRESIVFWKNKLVDGRNRAKACEELGIEPGESELDEDQDPIAYVVSANLHRRHLTTSQRADIAAKLATAGRGGDRKSQKIKGSNDPLKIADAAKLLNVSEKSVKRAKAKGKQKSNPKKPAPADVHRKRNADLLGVSEGMVDLGSKVLQKGTPELIAATERGDMDLNRAAKIADLPPEQQSAAIEEQQKKKRKAKSATPTITEAEIIRITAQLIEILTLMEQTACEICEAIPAVRESRLRKWFDLIDKIEDHTSAAFVPLDEVLKTIEENRDDDDAGGADE